MGAGSIFIPLLMGLALIFAEMSAAKGSGVTKRNDHIKLIVGAILDSESRAGKEERVAMQMAVEEFNAQNNQSLVLLPVKNCHKEPLQAAIAAQDLIGKNVQAILGPNTWEETSLVAEIGGGKIQMPILSFADSTPDWAMKKWPFLFQVSPNKHKQMNAIAAIVQSYEWHQVTVIYEETDSSITTIMPHLSDALQEVGAEITHVLALPPSGTSSLFKDLERLKRRQCRVFVVHLSFHMTIKLFETAKKMKMMQKGYVWIATDAFTSVVHSLGASVTSSMQGVLGIKAYFPEKEPRFPAFSRAFRIRFFLEYPEEDNYEPGNFAIQAYDATWRVAEAMRESIKGGQQLLEKILTTDLDGLAGKLKFTNRKVSSTNTFQIINIIGRTYKELGFWSEGHGFSKTFPGNSTYFSSMNELGLVLWPGGPRFTPRGWTHSTAAKPLKIGVPTESIFKQYVSVEFDPLVNDTSFNGYSIQLFKAVNKQLPFDLPYKFVAWNGSYTALVEQISLKKFDAAVGDIAIVASRFQYADFTAPYTESELVMVVPVQTKTSNKAWLFTRPFTKTMWILICIINIYNGFVVWLIERNHCSELRGTIMNQMGVLVWLSFTTFLSLQGSKLHSNLSRMAIVVWLFVALVLTQTYTANLASIITVQGLEPVVNSIEALRSSNAVVGHFKATFVTRYLEDVLHFNPKNMKNYTSPEDCFEDLRNREIAAVFLEKPYAKLFLARYCNVFTIAGPSFKVGGFAFAFPKGSQLLHHVTAALVNVTDSGQLQDLEKNMVASQKCIMQSESNDEPVSLNPSSFWILFMFSGGTSTLALIVYSIHCHSRTGERCLWTLMLAIVKRWRHQGNHLPERGNSQEI